MRKGFEHPPGLGIEVSIHPFAFSITERGLFFKYLIWSCLRASSPGRSERRAGKGREVATTSLEFEYLHRKSRCKMLIGGDDISNDVITLCTWFSMFVYIRARFYFGLIG